MLRLQRGHERVGPPEDGPDFVSSYASAIPPPTSPVVKAVQRHLRLFYLCPTDHSGSTVDLGVGASQPYTPSSSIRLSPLLAQLVFRELSLLTWSSLTDRRASNIRPPVTGRTYSLREMLLDEYVPRFSQRITRAYGKIHSPEHTQNSHHLRPPRLPRPDLKAAMVKCPTCTSKAESTSTDNYTY